MTLLLRSARLLLCCLVTGALISCGDKEPVSGIPAGDLDRAIAAVVDPSSQSLDVASLPSINDPLAMLGRSLFFSRSLSGDGDVACVSCHHPLLAGADGLSLSVGVQSRQPLKLGPGRLIYPDSGLDPVAKDGPNVPRNAPTTFNIGLYNRFMFHDGRLQVIGGESHPNGAGQLQRSPDSFQNLADPQGGANLTETQARFPVTSLFEMRGYGGFSGLDNQGTRLAIEERLQLSAGWVQAFRAAFARPDASPAEVVTYPNVAKALGEYQRSQVFVDNAWSRYLRGERGGAGREREAWCAAVFPQP